MKLLFLSAPSLPVGNVLFPVGWLLASRFPVYTGPYPGPYRRTESLCSVITSFLKKSRLLGVGHDQEGRLVAVGLLFAAVRVVWKQSVLRVARPCGSTENP